MENSEISCSQSTPQLNIDEHNSNNQINSKGDVGNSENAQLHFSFSQDANSDKCIDTITENDTSTSDIKQQQHKAFLFYHTEGKSEPNLVDCHLVPRSPSTAVQLDMNDLKNRDQDVIYSDKFHFNDSSSNVSYASISSIPMNHDLDHSPQKNQEKQIQEQQCNNNNKTTVQQKQMKQDIQINQQQTSKKIPKIPDIFYYSKQNSNHNGINKNDKLSYSWPKKRNQKVHTNHPITSSQSRYTQSINKQLNKKKD